MQESQRRVPLCVLKANIIKFGGDSSEKKLLLVAVLSILEKPSIEYISVFVAILNETALHIIPFSFCNRKFYVKAQLDVGVVSHMPD